MNYPTLPPLRSSEEQLCDELFDLDEGPFPTCSSPRPLDEDEASTMIPSLMRDFLSTEKQPSSPFSSSSLPPSPPPINYGVAPHHIPLILDNPGNPKEAQFKDEFFFHSSSTVDPHFYALSFTAVVEEEKGGKIRQRNRGKKNKRHHGHIVGPNGERVRCELVEISKDKAAKKASGASYMEVHRKRDEHDVYHIRIHREPPSVVQANRTEPCLAKKPDGTRCQNKPLLNGYCRTPHPELRSQMVVAKRLSPNSHDNDDDNDDENVDDDGDDDDLRRARKHRKIALLPANSNST